VHELKPLSETPLKPDLWPSSAVHSLVTGLMETEGGLWPYYGQGGWTDAHWVFVLAQNTNAGTDAQGPWVSSLALSTKAGMDAWVPWLVIEGSRSVFGPGLLGLSELSVGADEMTGRVCRVAMDCWCGFGFHQGWPGGGPEGIKDATLCSTAPDVTWISQNCPKGVMGRNTGSGS